ncbi:GNAT family N-acetyltransferase [Blastococcus sp. LR1]|uniref:GNAT family N-acetyltransferase n=1 Tax=Blastococcus sp. LR1 TaxID=2877000 RepID=UPI001CCE67E2|nr:N-acetyltransferase [Blastococcus sp. LR1]MCA0143687.1 N-acetyltransferase [Blastococcus sp. LR1]
MIVRRERPSDSDAVRAVHRAAFALGPGSDARRAPGEVPEADLLDRLREDAGFLPHLSLVAMDDDGDVVGHVIATRGWLEPFGTAALGLGPLGVVPAAQGRGTGTALMHALLAVAEAAGERLVALLGSPDYYGRFGFVPALDLGVTAPDPSWGPYFQARLLQGDPVGGAFRYAEPFSHL